MIIVRIETDIVPCAPRQLFRTRLPGFFLFLWSMQMRDGIIKRFEKDFTFRG